MQSITIEPAATDKRHKIMITIDKVVLNKKGQKGTITRIITKSTGYVEVAYEYGSTKKEMAFNLTDENGAPLKKAPAKKMEEKSNPIKVWQDIAMSVNDKWNSNSTWILAEQVFGKLDCKKNNFIESLLESMFRKNRISEEQAYYLAKYGVESGQLK